MMVLVHQAHSSGHDSSGSVAIWLSPLPHTSRCTAARCRYWQDLKWDNLFLLHNSSSPLCAVDITLYGGEKSTRALGLPEAPSPKHEYGSLALTLELVDSMDEAIDHIHKFGSSHTESIVTGARWTAPGAVPASF